MSIFYASAPSPFGLLLAASTRKGLCFIGLGDDEPYLITDLQSRYPNITLNCDAPAMQAFLDVLLAYLNGQPNALDLALDTFSGTPFQQQVWSALCRVGYGQTLTYSELTASMGKPPKAVRAVAHGCATNPVSLVIPCHRIVRSDGSLGGYYWGLPRKRALLEMEGGIKKVPAQEQLF